MWCKCRAYCYCYYCCYYYYPFLPKCPINLSMGMKSADPRLNQIWVPSYMNVHNKDCSTYLFKRLSFLQLKLKKLFSSIMSLDGMWSGCGPKIFPAIISCCCWASAASLPPETSCRTLWIIDDLFRRVDGEQVSLDTMFPGIFKVLIGCKNMLMASYSWRFILKLQNIQVNSVKNLLEHIYMYI